MDCSWERPSLPMYLAVVLETAVLKDRTDPTDLGTCASLLESGHPEPQRGWRETRREQTGDAHRQDGTCSGDDMHPLYYQHVTPEVSTSIWKTLWEDLGKEGKVSCIEAAVL